MDNLADLINQGVSGRIRFLRKSSGLSQKALSIKLGVSPVLVNQFETSTRRPRDVYIKAIANLYEVREEWLLNGTGEMKPKDEDMEEISTIAAEIANILRNSSKEYARSLLDFLNTPKS
ncbi:MAG: helix-turn-helix domain-containing protein [Clostridiales bacterium]|jgi:transcriptional regulator with XRE-family HTH domain|nr:helix-turn-helix domain-containing protein [Clostridiales bacterium]